MADITSVKLPNNSEYNIKDAAAQTATMSAAITVDGTSQTTVEGALGAINTLAAANKSGKADKVTSPTSGDFAALDSSGNLTDSGKKAADFATDDEMSAVVDVLTAKNFIYYPYLGTVVGTGITWTDNGDGSVTANGTAGTGGCSYLLNSQASGKFVKKPAGTYKLTGCPSGGASNYWLVANMADNGTLMTMQDVGSGAERTFTTDMTIYTGEYIYLYVAEGKTVTNLTFYPMLRDARITDSTYAPFAKTNRELTVDKAERADLTDINIIGTTNTSGRTITIGAHFYLNNQFCRAKADISANATFTLGTNYVAESAYKDSGWVQATLNTSYFSSGGVWYRTIGEKCYVTFQGCVPIAAVDAIIATGLPKADTFFSGCASPENGSAGRAVFIQQNDTVLRTHLVDTQPLWGSIEYIFC